ncbi:DUF6113 family protein [Streptomyces indicus]|uniref:Integral membrane protein n=1 Tax=Streptomyces indicus TaxID=417292 RepID=A0A1G9FYB5_9ACTN|nr:DUF6113 family protein [Streptomyces indicus]SDK93305.1 hypothetical protein SAMN05421806_114134 [Streptomyces indicus]
MSSTPKPARATSGPKADRSGPERPAQEPVKPLPTGVRVLVYVVLVILGVLAGVAGALLQAAWFPAGLLLALLGAAGVFYGGARALGARAGAYAPCAGWLLTVLFLTTTRPEGDFVFGTGVSSYLYLLGGMAVAVMCATLGAPSQPGGLAARLAK